MKKISKINRLYLKYSEAKPLINEADVLLFRGKGFMSYMIGVGGESPYSHVALASWINGNSNTQEGILECVEFREGSPFAGILSSSNGRGGGRAVNLGVQVNQYPNQIDVYRPIPYVTSWVFDAEEKVFSLTENKLNAKEVTRTMRKMTGLPYGWSRIWWLMKHKLVGFRMFTDVESLMADRLEDIVYPVCSTAVAYSFNKNGYDLINNKSDQWTEPADIARSARLSYLFTLTPDGGDI